MDAVGALEEPLAEGKSPAVLSLVNVGLAAKVNG